MVVAVVMAAIVKVEDVKVVRVLFFGCMMYCEYFGEGGGDCVGWCGGGGSGFGGGGRNKMTQTTFINITSTTYITNNHTKYII